MEHYGANCFALLDFTDPKLPLKVHRLSLKPYFNVSDKFYDGTVVVYGYQEGQKMVTDANTGKPNARLVKMHRDNIATIRMVVPSNNESTLGD